MVQSESGSGPVTTPTKLRAGATFPDASSLVVDYDRGWDILYLILREPHPAVSVGIDGEAWARMIPETSEIVGFEIEEFEHRFLAHHPDLAAAWRATRRPGFFGVLRQPQPQAFLAQVLGFLRSTLVAQAVQPASSLRG